MIKIREIKIKYNEPKDYILDKVSKLLRVDKERIELVKILKESIDARKKPDIYFVYEVVVNVNDEDKYIDDVNIFKYVEEEYKINITGNLVLSKRPIIVGSGPAGLLSAYLLSLNGFKPLILERGEDVDKRVETVNKFWIDNILNEESNVQYGEGGAGTFSDGKLNTLVKDKNNRMKKVFELFVECGADPCILYSNKPHIGTDVLRKVVKNLRNIIISNGGEFRFNTKLTNIIVNDNKIEKIEVNNNELIDTDVLILAIGNSSRDTFKMLYENGIKMESKPFAVGIRVIHPQALINKSQYGDISLPPASYKLTYNTSSNRGVYSFCMCPGGFVVNSSSEKNHLVVNGMSNSKRDESCANSAIIVTVNSKDFGNDIFSGINFQKEIEFNSYKEGNGIIPVQLYKDLKNNVVSKEFGSFTPAIKGKYTFANLNNIYPKYIIDSFIEGMEYFGKKINGFNNDDTILVACETRTSSPIRIVRDENLESSIKGIYPCGEGSGYSGGITTSAVDSMKVVESLLSKYKSM